MWRYWLGLPSRHIGAVVDLSERRVYAVINPDYDAQLDDPSFLQVAERPLTMLRIPRKASPFLRGKMHAGDCAEAQRIAEQMMGVR